MTGSVLVKFIRLLVFPGLFILILSCGGSDGGGSGGGGVVIDTSGRGCGSGWNTDVVRDEYWDVSFHEACKHHDVCYETCGVTKAHCDDTFYEEMNVVCKDTYPDPADLAEKSACMAGALLYYDAVRVAGEDAFNEAQKQCR